MQIKNFQKENHYKRYFSEFAWYQNPGYKNTFSNKINLLGEGLGCVFYK